MELALQQFLDDPLYHRYFEYWQAHGFHLTPVHYYSPVPDTSTIGEDLYQKRSEMVGIDLKVPDQLYLLKDIFPTYRQEYDQIPHHPTGQEHDFYFSNDMFSGADAMIYYCLLRHFKPPVILEVGSGFSTRLAARAAILNEDSQLICIEPYPSDILRNGFPGMTRLIEKSVQELGLQPFLELKSGDILFIDTSHISKIGSEVNFLYLEVLPRLRPGVIVQIHDIFLPREYPKEWIEGTRYFFNEQYLVQAFLAFNQAFEVIFSTAYMYLNHEAEIRAAFPKAPYWSGGSLWLRRTT